MRLASHGSEKITASTSTTITIIRAHSSADPIQPVNRARTDGATTWAGPHVWRGAVVHPGAKYLPRDVAALYCGPLQDLAEQGHLLSTTGRAWAAPADDGRGGSVSSGWRSRAGNHVQRARGRCRDLNPGR